MNKYESIAYSWFRVFIHPYIRIRTMRLDQEYFVPNRIRLDNTPIFEVQFSFWYMTHDLLVQRAVKIGILSLLEADPHMFKGMAYRVNREFEGAIAELEAA